MSGMSAPPARSQCALTVKLRDRPEALDQAPRVHNLSRARGADTPAVHDPLQRLLGGIDISHGNKQTPLVCLCAGMWVYACTSCLLSRPSFVSDRLRRLKSRSTLSAL